MQAMSRPALRLPGPREKIFFDPSKLACGIVTCGGLCPGLNDVIRSIVLSLHHHYGVRTIYGFPYGYEGLVPKFGHQPITLTPEVVCTYQRDGRHHARLLPRQPGRLGNGRYPGANGDRHPLLHRRRRHAAGRPRYQRGSRDSAASNSA